MHASVSTRTYPVASSLNEAPVGHTSMQAAFSHCWHCTGSQYFSTLGKVPKGPIAFTLLYAVPKGRACSSLQHTTHESHPEQRSRLMSSPLRI